MRGSIEAGIAVMVGGGLFVLGMFVGAALVVLLG